MKKVLLMTVSGTLLLGCATPNTISPQGSPEEITREQYIQREMAFKRVVQESKRVDAVAYPILVANAPLCQNTAYSAGVSFWNSYIVPEEYRDVAKADYGLGETLKVLEVNKNSPADKAGVRVGDDLIGVNDKKVPPGVGAAQRAADMLLPITSPEMKLTLSRNGKQIDKIITRKKICNYSTIYDPDDQSVNAFADGENVHISRGVLRFVESDTELALVISHEFAHNAMGHIDKKRTNAMAAGAGGLLVDILFAAAGVNTNGTFTDAASRAGGGAYSVEFEQEADYVGMYFMERAGYKTNNVANFWRRMSAENAAASIDVRTSHPTSPERFIAIEKTREEIQKKKAKGVKLVPEIGTDEETQKRAQIRTQYNN